MAEIPQSGARSTAAIGGHPIHPMLVPFPIGFLVGALLADIMFAATGDAFWARAAIWLVGAGVIGGLAAAVFGFVDFVTIRRARGSIGWLHFGGNLLAVALSAANWWLRYPEPASGSLLLSLIVVAILVVTGWLGGELAYRHKIGVID